MLARWAIPLGRIDPQGVRPDQVHAVVCSWVDDEHRPGSPKPWSTSPVRIVDGVAVLEINTLTPTSADRLHDEVSAGQPVRFGGQMGRVLATPQPVAACCREKLGGSVPKRAWTVQFRSPTTFGKGGRRNFFSPWPDPTAVVRSLTHHWNAVVGAEHLALDRQQVGSIWVSDVDGRNEIVTARKGLTMSGFLGRIRYVCEDTETAEVFHKLLHFAEYSGMGRYSTHGLGTVRLEPTWATVG